MKSVRTYLPSAQFALLTSALLLAAGLVYAAQRFTTPQVPTNIAVSSQESSPTDSNWQATLYTIQAQNASTSIPQPLSPDEVNQTLQAAQSPNITNTVGQTLLVDFMNAKSQGLGDDTPTQEQILADATNQIQQGQSVTYTADNLTVVSDSDISLHAYGNGVMAVLQKYPAANATTVLLAMGDAVDNGDQSQAQALPPVENGYGGIVKDLLAVPVPTSLAPLDILIINDFEGMSESIPGIEVMLSDPLRGAAAAEQFTSFLSEENRVFTNVAQQLQSDGILFSKSEPGSMWSAFLTPTS